MYIINHYYFMQVWGLLNNNDFVNDPVKLKSIFDKSGVEEASDLKLLDEVTLKSYYYLYLFWFNYYYYHYYYY